MTEELTSRELAHANFWPSFLVVPSPNQMVIRGCTC